MFLILYLTNLLDSLSSPPNAATVRIFNKTSLAILPAKPYLICSLAAVLAETYNKKK